MRYREDNPAEHARARAAVAEWREAHPDGTVDQMVADVGPLFRRDYAIVLRGLFYAGVPGTAAVADDCVERRVQFEAAHPEVQILPPKDPLRGPWRATVPAGEVAGKVLVSTVTAWSLCDLMDKLETAYRPDVTPSES